MVRGESTDEIVEVPAEDVDLEGRICVPTNARGVVAFAHGSGSSRHSPRNRFVAEVLRAGGMGTLLIDLLTEHEEAIDVETREFRFDIDLLADRLAGVVEWIDRQASVRGLEVGLFGSSTGAAAALKVAGRLPEIVGAVVSRGGRADLADEELASVRAPTLLVVGGNDETVVEMNRSAMRRMQAIVELEIIPGASHLFEEPGTLEAVAELARGWFQTHLKRRHE